MVFLLDSNAKLSFDPSCLFKSGFELGSADLILGDTFEQVLIKTTVSVLLMLKDEKGNSALNSATIILPPTMVTEHTSESTFNALFLAVKELIDKELDKKEKNYIRKLVRVVHSPSLEISDLIRTIDDHAQYKQHAFIISDANKYQDINLFSKNKNGITSITFPEDRWVPHISLLCKKIVELVKKIDGYGFIHVANETAFCKSNIDILTSVDDCYVCILSNEGDPSEFLYSRSSYWRSMAFRGLLNELGTEIDNLSLPDSTKLHLLIQALKGTGNDAELFRYIEKILPYLPELPSFISIQIATIVLDIGHDELALDILPISPVGILDQAWVEQGLELALQLRDNDRIKNYDDYLEGISPNSLRLKDNRDRRLILNCQKTKSENNFLLSDSGFSIFQLNLQSELLQGNPDYESIIGRSDVVEGEKRDLATVCCAIHARHQDNLIYAAILASSINSISLYSRQATMILLSSIRRIILRQLISKEDQYIYKHFFRKLFQFISINPEDEEIRRDVHKLLSVESCGDMGIPLVAVTVLDLTYEGVLLSQMDTHSKEKRSFFDTENVETSIKNGLEWLDDLGVVEPGITILPRELLIVEPDDFIDILRNFVEMASGKYGEEIDTELVRKLVFLACSVAPYATLERNTDLSLIKHYAGLLSMQGQFQKARDLAETLLRMGAGDAYRSRLAWQGYGDIYHRCRNHTNALIGLASALAINVEIKRSDCWSEVYTLHRIFRDLGLLEFSRLLLTPMKSLLTELGYDASNDLRQLNCELNLRLLEADTTNTDSMSSLLFEIVAACKKANESRDRIHPFALLLGQAVLIAEKAGVKITSVVQSTLDVSLKQAGIGMADIVRTNSVAKPNALDVLKLFNNIEPAKYSNDIVYDRSFIEISARRLLNSNPIDEKSIFNNIFATELLAEHSINLNGNESVMLQDSAFTYSLELNKRGLDVVFLALDSQGELIVTIVSNGTSSAVEQPKLEMNFKDRFNKWLQSYPRDYGRIARYEGNNIFYLTMEELDIRLPNSERLLIVAEPFLQQLTANLFLIQPEDSEFNQFMGINTAIGSTPSLSWLESIRKVKRSSKKGYKAWISAESNSISGESNEFNAVDNYSGFEPENEKTLDIALNRLNGCFVEFGFNVNTNSQLPRDMHDSNLVVVTAHGGLNIEGRYLHSISDDRDLVESPSALAAALRGVELVILFVCSGGRLDKNPWGNSTTSLPKQLLNNGCRTVIASPWPLDVMVTYNWLEIFMREWERNATVLDATKRANDYVEKHLGNAPQYSLAMRVYGDVLLVRPDLSIL